MPTQRKRTSSAARRRVVDLLDAIAKLHRGDLLAILGCTPLVEFGENDTFHLDENGQVVQTRVGPAKRSLSHRVQKGEDLARILEAHLEAVLVFGEGVLPTIQRRGRRNELGGRIFKW
jgi:hypothetical protein